MKNIFIIVTLGCVVFGDTSEVTSVSVMEGDSITLHINLTDIKQDEKIYWRFGPEGNQSLLARIVDKNIRYEDSESFRGRLELNIQTGDLTIKNTRIKHSRPYKAVIVRNIETSFSFNVKVNESAHADSGGTDEETVLKTKGESVTLNTDVQTHRDDLILWRFGDEGLLIAKHDKDYKSPIYDVGGFKDRLQVDDRTGSLTISDVRSSDSGLYKLKISSNSKQTLYKTFSVYVSDGGLSPGAIVGIVFVVLLAAAVVAAAAAGVIYYRRRISELLAVTVKEITAMEGECITLPTGVPKLQSDDEIEWRFGKEEIIAKTSERDGKHILNDVDERFTDRLMLNDETGDLIILNIKTKHSGLYNLKVTSRTGTSCSQFSVMVYARNYPARLGNLVTLTAEIPERKEVEQILWTFGDKDIRIARFIKEDNRPIKYYNYTDERFKDKLKLDPESGDLTIKAFTREHSGVYRQHVFCTNRTEYRKFNLFILLEAEEGKSFTLQTGVEIRKGDEVEWISPQKKITLASGIIGEKHNIKYTPDVRFRGRLEMNSDTGDLTISDVKETDFEEYTLKQHRTEGNIGTRRKYMLNDIKVKAPGKKLNKQKPGMRGNQMAPDEGQPLNDV